MSIERDLDEIEEADLRRLIADPVLEGKTIEFKETLELQGKDEQKRKLVASVASFANASGGDMIFGVRADGGRPVSLHPLAGLDPDATLLSLRDLLRAHLAPKVFGVGLHPVALAGGGHALVVRIPKTWAGPHLVTYNGDQRFYTRDGNGRVLMDVNEIRAAFARTEAAAERIRRFRQERLGDIVADETPVILTGRARVVLHLCPLAAFEPGYACDLEAVVSERTGPLRPMQSSGWDHRFDFDGYYALAGGGQGGGSDAYTKLFRSGCIEAVDSSMLEPWGGEPPRKVIPSTLYEEQLLQCAGQGMRVLKLAGVPPPVLLMLSLTGVKGYAMAVGAGSSRHGVRTIGRDQLLVPEVVAESLDLEGEALARLLKRLFDPVWNACGWPGSRNYDVEGRWQPQR